MTPRAVRAAVGAAALVVLVGLVVGCGDDRTSAGATEEPVDAPAACVDAGAASRTSVEGDVAWVRFCPGPDGLTAPAEVPSGLLTTHLDLLDDVGVTIRRVPGDLDCRRSFSRTYRLQIGYAEGAVAEVSGATGPSCTGKVLAGGALVRGPEDLGVYGVVMAAFGLQHADRFDAAGPGSPLTCPADPRDPDSVDADGESAGLETGYHLGRPEPMLMPLPAVRGIECTWQHGSERPTVRELTAEEAERVRIGMHAIYGAMVDCGSTPDPTYTAVVEDETGTRRAVTVIGSECSTVIRSDEGYGLGFPWLDR